MIILRRRQARVFPLLCWLALSPSAGASPALAADLLIRGGRVIDGTGAPPRPHTDILVRNGRIAAVGEALSAPGVPVVDATGATVLPGLIDAHVHLAVVPGAGQRDDSPDVLRQLRLHHLRAYLACGVTTVLDTGIPVDVVHEVRDALARGNPGPAFLTLGPGLTTPGGYMSEVFAGVASAEDVERRVAVVAGLSAVGVKVFMERGFGPRAVWPIHPPAVREAIVAAARARDLPIYVHAQREEDKLVALDMGARAIVHAGFTTAEPSDAFVQRMVASRAYLMTTFHLMDGQRMGFHPERLDDPLLRRTVPPLELATARHPEAGRRLARAQLAMAEPWLPAPLRGPVASLILTDAAFASRLRSSQAAVRRLAAAGVPIVVGSDSGNWPIDPYHFHGPSSLREMELLGEAGFPPLDVIAASTRVPAAMLGLERELGTVEVGKRADLVIVRKDPLRSLRALRTVRWTVRDGVARTPSQWLRQ
jgi:imidazolonepropionase-like amidohydrolase